MLTRFHVRNYALLDEIAIDFRPGLNVLTGETGAGKSILLGALGLILGNRATSDMIRTGADTATIEALFDVAGSTINDRLPADIECDEGTLIIRRDVSRDGRNRCTVNGNMVTVSALKQLGNSLVDLHGQHEHQSLLDQHTHITFLDGYGDVRKLLDRTSQAFDTFEARQSELSLIDREIREASERRELYQYQLQELIEANVQDGEDAALECEAVVLSNAELLATESSGLHEMLSERENAIVDQLARVVKSLDDLVLIDPNLNEALESARTARFQLEDTASILQKYRDLVDSDPTRLAEIQDRLELLKDLKRKFGGSLQDVCNYRDRIAEEIKRISSADERRSDQAQSVETARQVLSDTAVLLSKARARVAIQLEKRVVSELSELGMAKTRFKVRITQHLSPEGPVLIEDNQYETDRSGIDSVEFLLSPNSGEDLKPLVSVASGGEISRIMLALKVILAELDRVPTLVFDEIDIGIGGRVAESIGSKLKLLSMSHQVMCITHLHQVACWGDTHFTVSKQEKKSRTITEIQSLNEGERVEEIARMLAGERVNETALTHAREILQRAKKDRSAAETSHLAKHN